MSATCTTDAEAFTVDETLAFLSVEPCEVAICGHVNPDGDSLGSALALAALLRAKGHTVTNLLASDKKAPELYEFLADYRFVPAARYREVPDLFIAVDLPHIDRLGEARAACERAKDTLVIDHHPDYSGFGRHYLGDVGASATGLIIWRLIRASGVAVSAEMARCCYIALVTDTGRFSFQNTTAEAFRAAGEMMAVGVDPADVNLRVYDSKSLASLQLDARLISRIGHTASGRVVYSWVTEEDFRELGVSRDETEGLPTILRSVRGTEVAILLREESGRIRVNLRAKGSCDVGEFARRFEGGGHRAAAGFTLATTLDAAKALILKEADALVC
ncbi:MAG: bifunctional oligoribonuclease/PAP phosphatase NrnA [Coriobacteriales bacterium]|jgi:phosphoesterase RecJ-like protein|nr:bifunctional oligoribonuclease/PAP phosphatase NrnA [Coriobacteriales bacterium]